MHTSLNWQGLSRSFDLRVEPRPWTLLQGSTSRDGSFALRGVFHDTRDDSGVKIARPVAALRELDTTAGAKLPPKLK